MLGFGRGERAQRRDARREEAIREALSNGDAERAADLAMAGLVDEIGRLRRDRPDDAELISAALAVLLTRLADGLGDDSGFPEQRPDDGSAAPEELLVIFESAMAALAGSDPLAELLSPDRDEEDH